MGKEKQIWYCEGSLAALVAHPLAQRYRLRCVPGPVKAAAVASEASNGECAAVCLADLATGELDVLRPVTQENPSVRLVGILEERPAGSVADPDLFACLPRDASPILVEKTIEAAFANIELSQRERALREELERAEHETDELNRIGVALSSTHNVNELLEIILSRARAITRADAGSLYLVEEGPSGTEPDSPLERRLRFKLTQNDSVEFPFNEFTLPLTEASMAGYAALRGEVVRVDDAYALLDESEPARPYHFNPKFDRDTRYRTRSMLTLPMKNVRGEVLGVVQLINCKRHATARLTSLEVVDREVQPFSDRAARLATSLASQAAVAYQNSRLYEDIETLFEGFVKAAVTAIEQRDPTTSGHSQRVSTMTVSLAETVDRISTGPYADVRFAPEHMKEIRYAALLHDFGKVGVREEILVKAKKLYPAQLALLQQRFDYVRKDLEGELARRKVELLLRMDRSRAARHLARLEEEYRRKFADLSEAFQFILQCNEPTVLPEGNFSRLLDIAHLTYQDPRGSELPLLTPEEVRFLSIPKGSLDPDERQQIESHVVHSFNFLLQIPWTREIKNIPWIARAHHEKLNGTGYPYQLVEAEIPVQAKIMTICDIFDALSASDRPYKKAVPAERALDILEMSVRDNELDPVLFQLFVDAKIWQLTHKRG